MTETDIPSADAVHHFFGLTYASYLVLPRVLLQSMPDDWQSRFVQILNEYDDAVREIKQAPVYDVTPGRETEVTELTEIELRHLGITVKEPDEDDPDGDTVYLDAEGREMDRWETVLVPITDPLPPYNRGRTKLQLNPA